MRRETVVVAGATGFVGRHLLNKLAETYNVIALTRCRQKKISSKRIKWKKVDLFSINEMCSAVKGADKVIYLIHSMVPSTKLFQGNFTDVDLLLADNLVRACEKEGVNRIIYLGGLLPKGYVSPHLKSRKEVESIFLSSSVPTTILRSGVIVGEQGSSFRLLKNLVLSLPIMIVPKWTKNITQIISLEDIIETIIFCCQRSDKEDKKYNLAIDEQLTYLELLKAVAKSMHKTRVFWVVPISLPKFSKSWVSYFGKTDISLVSPLVDSLLCDFSGISTSKEIKHLIKRNSLSEVVAGSKSVSCEKWLAELNRYKAKGKAVRSIQRLPSRNDLSSQEIASLYIKWLPVFFKTLVKPKIETDKVKFNLFGVCLLELSYVSQRSDKNRQLFYITDGLLVKRKDYGWLEFRQIDNKKYTLAVIHEFEPNLPWSLYMKTQAPLHSYTMKKFSWFLSA